jgi:DNA mismatch repair protein MutL
MADIIQLLPESVANQIAAGEVIQRPASVIKELVENAVDAGADQINIIIKDSGRSLIQVTDNGTGMSDTDARLSFERHATSKIRSADDLFEIRTKGFRGEALASIAAIAHVILRTRKHDEEIGTEIIINGSSLEHQVPVGCAGGSNFMVKNLFFNVPARRKFLKSNSTEFKHILNEFQRVVLSHPEIEFTLIHDDVDVYRLGKTNLRQRIVHVFGKSINADLNPISTETDLIKISGFIGKPEFARKTSGEQFFFINCRYMRHPYFHRAVMRAYEKILPPDTIPAYFIFMDADPSTIDVNIHPTKTEIKFESEQLIFQILQSAVREALGKSSVVPSIDFETEGVIDIPVLRKDTEIRIPSIEIDHAFNPFEKKEKFSSVGSHRNKSTDVEGWDQLYVGLNKDKQGREAENLKLFDDEGIEEDKISSPEYLQLRNKYILTSVKSGLMVIDQKRAHERILYEQFVRNAAHNYNMAQMELYPVKIDLDTELYMLSKEIKDELLILGLDISDLGPTTIVVNSRPVGFENIDIQDLVEQLFEEYKMTENKIGLSVTNSLAASLAKVGAINHGKVLQASEMQHIVDELFACENPNYSPDGKKTIAIVKLEDIDKLL